VHIGIDGQEKESLKVTATVRANRQKELLYILRRDKTNRVEKTQIEEITPHRTDHSESGWTTPETFARYPHWLSAELRAEGERSRDKHLASMTLPESS
jgi:hypothetical protein